MPSDLPRCRALLRVCGHQVGRNAQHALAARDQEPLEGPGHVPAILKRPDTFTVELAGPRQQRGEPRAADLDRALAHAARRSSRRRRRSCASACGCPLRARSWLSSSSLTCRRTAGGHGLLRALPRSYQVTPDIPDRRRATKQKEVRPAGRQPQRESARRRSGPSSQCRTSPTPRITTASLKGMVVPRGRLWACGARDDLRA